MNVLIDTNILGRLAEPGHSHYRHAHDSTAILKHQGDTLCVVPQVLYEFWVTATRPTQANGLGLSVAETASELVKLKTFFTFLPDSPAIYPEWERLVNLHQVTGKNAHDTRLVAAMAVHGLSHLLTFNRADFARFTSITVLDPTSMSASPPSPP